MEVVEKVVKTLKCKHFSTGRL